MLAMTLKADCRNSMRRLCSRAALRVSRASCGCGCMRAHIGAGADMARSQPPPISAPCPDFTSMKSAKTASPSMSAKTAATACTCTAIAVIIADRCCTAQQNSVASRDRLLLRVARGLLRWTWRYPRLAAISGLITTAEFHRFFT